MIEFGGAKRDVALPLAAGGSLLVFLVMAVVAYAIPLLEGDLAPETPVEVPSEEVARGRAVYESEGCWFCHTQSVRPVPGDLGLGLVTTEAEAGARHPPHGLSRVGPDLACVGDRLTSADDLAAHLLDPRARRPASVMPSLGYLAPQELSELVAYLFSLECEGA